MGQRDIFHPIFHLIRLAGRFVRLGRISMSKSETHVRIANHEAIAAYTYQKPVIMKTEKFVFTEPPPA